jgi:hypothetical protein
MQKAKEMKALKYILPAMVLATAGFTACDDIEAIDPEVVTPAYTYGPQYYQDLRDYKASDHEIAFGWFAEYGPQNSMAVRFMGLPDSLDICSLWGGIPTKPDVVEEMRFVQKVKGTKMLVVAITRIDAETDDKPFKPLYNEGRAEGDQEKINEAIRQYAEYFLDQIFLNDLDGFDADYEPEGNYLSGEPFMVFYRHLAQYLGPNPDITKEERRELIRERYGDEMANREGICDKLLCIDGHNLSSCEPYSNYFFCQSYGGGTGSQSGWPDRKIVHCENVGDNWKGNLQGLYNQASWKPASGRKGGFGAFFIHRNYNVTETNIEPYYHFRRCIQIQNPAIH